MNTRAQHELRKIAEDDDLRIAPFRNIEDHAARTHKI
jgi:hypothetical protein